MKYKKYRLCLLSIIVLVLIGGFFYYRNNNTQAKETEGTFVERVLNTGMYYVAEEVTAYGIQL